jgi:hypothetical protein
VRIEYFFIVLCILIASMVFIVSVVDSSNADFGIKHGGVKLKIIKLVFAAFPLSTQH